MSADEKLQKILSQNRARQKKYYEAHKENIKKKAAEVYKAGREAVKNKPEPVVWETNTYKTFDDILNKFVGVHKVTYSSPLRTLIVNILDGPSDFLKVFKNPDKVIPLIRKATFTDKNGEELPFANNSIVKFAQLCTLIITDLKLKENKKITLTAAQKYVDFHQEMKIKSYGETSQKKVNGTPVMLFEDYIQKVKDVFGENSKEYTLVSLYQEATLRDDFHSLQIIHFKKEATDDNVNYIVVPAKGLISLIINSFKTQARYGVLKFNLSPKLSTLLRNYIHNRKQKKDLHYLFGDTKALSPFVSNINKKLQLKNAGGINYLRHMKASDPNLTDEERIQLSKRMAHSPLTSLTYIRRVVLTAPPDSEA